MHKQWGPVQGRQPLSPNCDQLQRAVRLCHFHQCWKSSIQMASTFLPNRSVVAVGCFPTSRDQHRIAVHMCHLHSAQHSHTFSHQRYTRRHTLAALIMTLGCHRQRMWIMLLGTHGQTHHEGLLFVDSNLVGLACIILIKGGLWGL